MLIALKEMLGDNTEIRDLWRIHDLEQKFVLRKRLVFLTTRNQHS